MKRWKALSSAGGVIGIILTVAVTVLFGLVLQITLAAALQPDIAGANLGTFGLGLLAVGLLLAAVALAYRTYNYYKLSYSLDRNAITVYLGDRKQVIPLADIRHVLPAGGLLQVMAQEAAGPVVSKPGDVGEVERVRVYASNSSTIGNASGDGSDFDEDDFFNTDAPLRPRAENARTETADDDIVEAELVEVEPVEPTPSAADAGNVRSSVYNQNTARPTQFNAALPKVRFKPFGAWPGYYVTTGWVEQLGPVQFYATAPFSESLLVRTADNTYAITPANPQEFMTEYRLRRNLGPTEEVVEGVQGGLVLNHPLWRDWLGRGLLMLGVLANLALFVYLFLKLPTTPDTVRIHFDKFGTVDRIGNRTDLMILPFIGLLAAVVNSVFGVIVHRRDRIAARLLYLSIIIVQFMVWVALLGILAS